MPPTVNIMGFVTFVKERLSSMMKGLNGFVIIMSISLIGNGISLDVAPSLR